MDQRGNLMKQSSFYQFYDRAEDIRHKFISALPVIVFFLLMFYSVIFLFGTQYVMVVSLATLLFQVNYKKQHSFDYKKQHSFADQFEIPPSQNSIRGDRTKEHGASRTCP